MSVEPSRCPEDERICAVVEGSASAGERQLIVAHIEACSSCRDLVALLLRSDDVPSLPQPPQRLGDYQLLRVLGRGAMGVVYEAHDCELDRKVAIKLLRCSYESEAERRMLRESRAMAKLSHPNVVAIHHIDRHDGRIALVMELVEGTTLSQWRASGTRSWQEIAGAFAAAGQGLLAAHRVGLVHRDFKPDNVLVHRDGRVMVGDFGLALHEDVLARAKVSGDRRSLETGDTEIAEPERPNATRSSWVRAGTPAYVAPEVLTNARVDARADQFSYAVALYESLWEQHPFSWSTRAELFAAVRAGAVRTPPRQPRVPRRLRQEILRALSPDPNDRAPTLEPLLQALAASNRTDTRIATIVLATAAVACGGLIMLRPSATETCARAMEQRLERAWNPALREAVRAALVESAGPAAQARFEHVAVALDRHAQQWVAAAQERCLTRDAHDHEEAVEHQTLEDCLDRSLRELATSVELLATRDPVIAEHALVAAEGLDDPSRCSSATARWRGGPRPEDPVLESRVARLRRVIAKADIVQRAGLDRDAEALLVPAEEEARQLGWKPVLAEAQLMLGRLRRELDDPAVAEAMFRKAALSAEAGAHDEVAAAAWNALTSVAVHRLYDRDAAKQYAEHADAALERLGRPPQLQGEYWLNQGLIAWVLETDADRALSLYEQARVAWEDAAPEDVPRALAAMAQVHRVTGEADRALEIEQQNIAVMTEIYGGEHPFLAYPSMNLGIALMYVGRHDDAVAPAERAIELARVAGGEKSHELAIALHNLSTIYRMAARYDDARRAALEAASMFEAIAGPEYASTLRAQLAVADILLDTRQDQSAADIYAKVLPRLESARVEPDAIAGAQLNYAMVLQRLGSYRESRALARKTLSYFERIASGKPTLTRGLALYAVGVAERGLGNVSEAVASLTHSLEMLRSVGADSRTIADAESALASARGARQ